MDILQRAVFSGCVGQLDRKRGFLLYKELEHHNKASLPCLSVSLLHSLCHLPLSAVPTQSPVKLGGRCCCAKLALKCLPGSPISPTTQSNHIRSLYLCLGQVQHCSCVHPHSTFGVEGPGALIVRTNPPPKKNSFSLSPLHLPTIQQFALRWQWGRGWGGMKEKGGRGSVDAQVPMLNRCLQQPASLHLYESL